MKTKVGIASFAHLHAGEYADALGGLEAAEFVGVFDEEPPRGEEAAGRHGVRFFAELPEMLEEVEAVVVCSENRRHAAIAEQACEAGVHILCEKPLATNVAEARKMIETARRAGVRLGVAFPMRRAAAVREAKRAVEAGSIGRVVAVSGANPGKVPGGWFLDEDAAGGGAVMDHTVHVADLLRWILGAEIESVYAEIGSFFGSGIDDGAILTLELAGGTFATIDPSWSRGAAYPRWGELTLEITGTSGVVSVDVFAPGITVYDHDSRGTRFVGTGEDINQGMLEEFIYGVRSGTLSGASGEDGLRALEVALTAYESGRTGMPVRVASVASGSGSAQGGHG